MVAVPAQLLPTNITSRYDVVAVVSASAGAVTAAPAVVAARVAAAR